MAGRPPPGGVDRVIVFDLDDTLYLERDFVESGLHAVGAWADRQLGTEALAADLLRRFRAGERGHLFDDALRAAGLCATPERIARMIQVYRQHPPCISLADDAQRLFARLPPRIGLAIITDGFLDAQRRKIRALDLRAKGIHIAVCTDRWGREGWKPACRAFHYVQSFFALPPTSFTYIADNAEKDFVAPQQIGWSSVQIIRNGRLRTGTCRAAALAEREIESFDSLVF